MKGDAQPLIKFFDGSDKRFIIPLYQRNYDWKEENVSIRPRACFSPSYNKVKSQTKHVWLLTLL